jgi:FkbM family methyltransferase
MRIRLPLLKFWLSGHRNGVSFLDLLKNIFEPSYEYTAAKMIKKIEQKDGFHVISLEGINHPLYFPGEMDLHGLYGVITELLFPKNWHFYEKMGTEVLGDDIVVDCGAAEGLFSLWVAPRCKKVYAIEPLPRFVESMQRSFKGIDNIEIVPYAVSDEDGQINIIEHSTSSFLSSSKEGNKVKVATLDALFADKRIPVSYLKADVEGFELQLIRGARRTIERYEPKIAIAVYHAAGHAEYISRYLKEIVPDYKIRTIGIDDVWGAPMLLHATRAG